MTESKGGKALGVQIFSLSTGTQIHMAINASTSINSSVKAADSSFCSQRDLSVAASESCSGHRSSCRLSPEEIRYSRETNYSTGSSLPRLVLGSANSKERLREENPHGEW